jgi:aminoglycoside phosphotransferase (APT) family kinase protein
MLEQQLPTLISRAMKIDVSSAVRLGQGEDNVAWLINDDLVVRQANDRKAIGREVAVLEVVRRHSPVRVPAVEFADEDAGVLAYRRLPGTPLLTRHADVGRELGTLLGAVHAIALGEVNVERDDVSLTEWLDEARTTYAGVASVIPEASRAAVENFLASPPPAEPTRWTFCHNDLGAEHILVEHDKVTGIIDWTDAAIADPMRDFALILRDLGPGSLEAAIESYGAIAESDRERLVFYARCKLLEDLAYGVERDARYRDAALPHLAWTFAEPLLR